MQTFFEVDRSSYLRNQGFYMIFRMILDESVIVPDRIAGVMMRSDYTANY